MRICTAREILRPQFGTHSLVHETANYRLNGAMVARQTSNFSLEIISHLEVVYVRSKRFALSFADYYQGFESHLGCFIILTAFLTFLFSPGLYLSLERGGATSVILSHTSLDTDQLLLSIVQEHKHVFCSTAWQ